MVQDLVPFSKFLSLVLRHDPQRIGLVLDNQGWACIDELLEKASASGKDFSRDLLDRVVAENDKQRFAISDDGLKIRASQGHSIEVDLALEPRQPPEFLFHGTATRFLESIRRDGLKPGSRQHVHLSLDEVTASKVGRRHGIPIVLRIHAGLMSSRGHLFFLSDNGVWLTDDVPTEFIQLPSVD